ncbi:Os05g0119350 [Oryza sativa Japonica Group]|uniref:Os05g0119350 protein n=2 Tax=Oryza sativa subsp. japonica TaxID=39947 RepID=B9FM67_ORYSJ|nr:hypothetical protein OsJ_16917 [Oryza sativa Japonica Group]KAB8097868.1 hypothetical protein EE612_026728 [Oryza sativa]BAS92001.1 Os05g0119350 [Oryza sativa Japonica Group]
MARGGRRPLAIPFPLLCYCFVPPSPALDGEELIIPAGAWGMGGLFVSTAMLDTCSTECLPRKCQLQSSTYLQVHYTTDPLIHLHDSSFLPLSQDNH